MNILALCIQGALYNNIALFGILDFVNMQVLRRLASFCGIRRPQDFSCPSPERRIKFDLSTPLSEELLHFQKKLNATEYQHGTQHGDGDPMLYLYMEKALRAYPSLSHHVTRNTATARIPDEELFATPARDAHVASAMYNRTGCVQGSFPFSPISSDTASIARSRLGRCLDLRDWVAAVSALAKYALSAVSGLLSAVPVGAAQAASPPESQPANVVPPPSGQAPIGLASWIATPDFDSNPLFSFSGAAWLIIYHVGAASALQERWALSASNAKLCGTSSGSVVAVCTGSGLQLSDMMVRCFEKWLACNERVAGPFGFMGTLVEEAMVNHTPPNGHELCSDRLKLAVTSIQSVQDAHGKASPVLPVEDAGALFHPGVRRGLLRAAHISHFDSNDCLTNAVLASCYIPLYSDVPGRIASRVCHALQPDEWATARSSGSVGAGGDDAIVCWDGGLSSNYPRWYGQGELAEMRRVSAGGASSLSRFTVTVSPTTGAAVISPGQAQQLQVLAGAAQLHGGSTGVQPKMQAARASGRKQGGVGGGFASRGFVVDGDLCTSGWGPDETLFPMTPERWWGVFFAGRGHAQAWMAQHGFEPVTKPANRA